MITGITHVSVLVDDYDEALQWYTEKLGLEPRMDGAMGEGYRFVTVGVRGQSVEMVLHKPFGDRSARDVELRRIFTGSVLILSGEAISTTYDSPSTRGGQRW